MGVTISSTTRIKNRAFRQVEAAEAAFSVCNLGAEYLPKRQNAMGNTEEKNVLQSYAMLLKEHHLIKLFKVGWKILYDGVVFYTAGALLRFLRREKPNPSDPQLVSEMAQTARRLQTAITSGRPWRVGDDMDLLLTVLDGQTILVLTHLLQEYPTISNVICDEQGDDTSPHIERLSQIRSIHRFIGKVL